MCIYIYIHILYIVYIYISSIKTPFEVPFPSSFFRKNWPPIPPISTFIGTPRGVGFDGFRLSGAAKGTKTKTFKKCGCFQKYGENPPKWMVKIMENPIKIIKIRMIWGYHYFWKHPCWFHSFIVFPFFFWVKKWITTQFDNQRSLATVTS